MGNTVLLSTCSSHPFPSIFTGIAGKAFTFKKPTCVSIAYESPTLPGARLYLVLVPMADRVFGSPLGATGNEIIMEWFQLRYKLNLNS